METIAVASVFRYACWKEKYPTIIIHNVIYVTSLPESKFVSNIIQIT